MRPPNDVGETTCEVTPLKIGNTFHLCTPHSWAMALDADTGPVRWRFDPAAGMEAQRRHQTCRGVSHFLAPAVDDDFRHYDVATGSVLWETRIPAGGQATPMTHLDSGGEQVVLLVAGGHGSIGTRAGDCVLAYELRP